MQKVLEHSYTYSRGIATSSKATLCRNVTDTHLFCIPTDTFHRTICNMCVCSLRTRKFYRPTHCIGRENRLMRNSQCHFVYVCALLRPLARTHARPPHAWPSKANICYSYKYKFFEELKEMDGFTFRPQEEIWSASTIFKEGLYIRSTFLAWRWKKTY